MSHTLHVIDALTNQPFAGNSAAVCVLTALADEKWMKTCRAQDESVRERVSASHRSWLVAALVHAAVEVKFCGHATLACAFAIWETGVVMANQAALCD